MKDVNLNLIKNMSSLKLSLKLVLRKLLMHFQEGVYRSRDGEVFAGSYCQSSRRTRALAADLALTFLSSPTMETKKKRCKVVSCKVTYFSQFAAMNCGNSESVLKFFS